MNLLQPLRRACAVAPLLVLLAAGPAKAGVNALDIGTPVLPAQSGAIDLRAEASVTIVGARTLDGAGGAVAGAGDVNGDGVDDVIVGAKWADAPGRRDAGAAYVVFGRRDAKPRSRVGLAARGFRILGPEAHAEAGTAVAGAGDVDGDGLADLVVGAPRTNAGSQRDRVDARGAVFLVRGRRGGATVDLAKPDPGVTRLDGEANARWLGQDVDGGRDVDGDGRPDLAAASVSLVRAGSSPAVHVVTDAAVPGRRPVAAAAGLRLGGREVGSVALADDMTGDGRAEVAVGTFFGPRDPGVLARVVFGRPGPATVDLGALGSGGFAITGSDPRVFGVPVDGGGDVDGDGRGDVLVGAPGGDIGGYLRGGAFVVHGRAETSPVDTRRLGAGGLTISGPATNSTAGAGVALLGDLDADGLADPIVGAPNVTVRGRRSAGSAFTVLGRRGGGAVSLRTPRGGAFRLDGELARDTLGGALAPAGDFNGDGRQDLLVGAGGGRRGRAQSGVAYIVFGFGRRG